MVQEIGVALLFIGAIVFLISKFITPALSKETSSTTACGQNKGCGCVKKSISKK